jgi:pimeloyl-ACP methyl ester carboxylesterase
MQYVVDHPERVLSLTLHASGSPFGYGCTHGPDGEPNYPDFAGSGAGLISPEVRARFEAGDFTADSPFSPRSTLRHVIVKPTFQIAPKREDVLVEQMLMMAMGDEFYPGDSIPSPNWPFTGPGIYGPNNALSPKYLNLCSLGDLVNGPPILWVRGADDQLVSDNAMADPGTLGKLGIIPGWPGDEVYPPQPMVTQLRALLERYRLRGGYFAEVVLDNCGHSPMFEHADEFRSLLVDFLRDGRAEV